jgi:hypothetical protein
VHFPNRANNLRGGVATEPQSHLETRALPSKRGDTIQRPTAATANTTSESVLDTADSDRHHLDHDKPATMPLKLLIWPVTTVHLQLPMRTSTSLQAAPSGLKTTTTRTAITASAAANTVIDTTANTVDIAAAFTKQPSQPQRRQAASPMAETSHQLFTHNSTLTTTSVGARAQSSQSRSSHQHQLQTQSRQVQQSNVHVTTSRPGQDLQHWHQTTSATANKITSTQTEITSTTYHGTQTESASGHGTTSTRSRTSSRPTGARQCKPHILPANRSETMQAARPPGQQERDNASRTSSRPTGARQCKPHILPANRSETMQAAHPPGQQERENASRTSSRPTGARQAAHPPGQQERDKPHILPANRSRDKPPQQKTTKLEPQAAHPPGQQEQKT